jgi:DNA mismatch repair protein MutS
MNNACYILKEYIKYHDENTKKYGENTVVLMQVGGFYEIYAVENETVSVGADIYKLADILGIQVARRNKSISEISYDNFLMAGWNTFALPKFQKILLNHNYTIVLVNQVTEPPNPERAITDIISPGTVIDNYNNSDMNTLVSIYINVYPQQFDKNIYVVGLSAIDISTGQNYVHRIQSQVDDVNIWQDELFRIIHYYSPKETLIHMEDGIDMTTDDLCNMFVLSEKTLHLQLYEDSQYKKQSFQNEFFSQIFHNHQMTAVEYLGFEREPEITLSYIYMMQFIHEHKLENLTGLSRPIMKGDEKHLILSHNCIYQLYLIPNKEHESEKYNSLLSILNKCSTAIGRRLCKARLLYPILDPEELNKRYSMIEKFQEDDLYSSLVPNLRKILDIEKLHRRMALSLLSPYEFYSIHSSYLYLQKLTLSVLETKPEVMIEHNTTCKRMNDFMIQYETIFDIQELEKYSLINMSTSVFKSGIYPEIDIIQEQITDGHNNIDLIATVLGKYIDPKKGGSVKKDCNDKYGYHLYVTDNRAKTFKKRIGCMKDPHINCGELSLDLRKVLFVRKGSNTHIEFPFLNHVANKLQADQMKIQAMNKRCYLDVIVGFHAEHLDLFSDLVSLVGFLDLNTCMAKVSVENVYCKPEIIVSSSSSFVAKNIRHPIVEKVQTEIEYVPNDIHLSEDGILLFGTNACGKSTLMKSIGLALIMAQAGFFVPCSELKYSPYTQIFTRILNNDNIFRRQSSFAVEMSELRGILKRADNRSLVLGDEVCSGTETTSALSIVSASIKTLSDIKCSFIFTSHLHQLMSVPMVSKIESLSIFHLKIEYDPVSDLLIYKRKLENGSGPAIYGLEVCKSLDLGSDFISLARQVQIDITDQTQTLVNDKKSGYNSDVLMDKCLVCKGPSEHTHHIKEQHEASDHGIIDHHHKNISHNLVPLCESCHHKVHNENLRIYGYHQTSSGVLLNYEFIESNIDQCKKKFSKKQVSIILTFKDDIDKKKLKKSTLLRKLELEHNMNISSSTLSKILNDQY